MTKHSQDKGKRKRMEDAAKRSEKKWTKFTKERISHLTEEEIADLAKRAEDLKLN